MIKAPQSNRESEKREIKETEREKERKRERWKEGEWDYDISLIFTQNAIDLFCCQR